MGLGMLRTGIEWRTDKKRKRGEARTSMLDVAKDDQDGNIIKKGPGSEESSGDVSTCLLVDHIRKPRRKNSWMT